MEGFSVSESKAFVSHRHEFMAECLCMVHIHAALAGAYAEIGDDAGLSHAMKRIITYVRAAHETFQDLLKANSPKPADEVHRLGEAGREARSGERH